MLLCAPRSCASRHSLTAPPSAPTFPSSDDRDYREFYETDSDDEFGDEFEDEQAEDEEEQAEDEEEDEEQEVDEAAVEDMAPGEELGAALAALGRLQLTHLKM